MCVPPYGDGYCFREGGGHKNLTRFVQIWLPVEIEVTSIYITYCRSDISLLRTSSYLIYSIYYTIYIYIYTYTIPYICILYYIYIYFDICMYQYHVYSTLYCTVQYWILNAVFSRITATYYYFTSMIWAGPNILYLCFIGSIVCWSTLLQYIVVSLIWRWLVKGGYD